MQAENAALKTELNSTGASLSSRLKDTEMLAANLTTELERIKLANADQINKLQLHHAEALATERENNIRQREEERITAEREKRSIELKYEEKVFFQDDLTNIYFVLNTIRHSYKVSPKN